MITTSAASVVALVLLVQEDFAFRVLLYLLFSRERVVRGFRVTAPAPSIRAQGETPSPTTKISAEDPHSALQHLSTNYAKRHPTQKVRHASGSGTI